MKRTRCARLVFVMIFALTACSSKDAKLEKFVAENKAEVIAGMEEAMLEGGLTGYCDLRAEGTSIVYVVCFDAFADFTDEQKEGFADEIKASKDEMKEMLITSMGDAPIPDYVEGVGMEYVTPDGEILVRLDFKL